MLSNSTDYYIFEVRRVTMSSSSASDAILRWLSSCFGVPLPSPSSVTDGVEMANILHAVDAQFFSQQWKGKIKVWWQCTLIVLRLAVKLSKL